MGYDTTFEGGLYFDRALAPEHRAYLEAFSRTRRVRRNSNRAAALPDPVRSAAGLPVGIQGAYFVGGAGEWGELDDESVLDGDKPPVGQPGLGCDWVPDPSGVMLQWNGAEKFYAYIDWLEYLLEHFIAPWGYRLEHGRVYWQGQQYEDRGFLEADKGRVFERRLRAAWPASLGAKLHLHSHCPLFSALLCSPTVLGDEFFAWGYELGPRRFAGAQGDAIDLAPLRAGIGVFSAWLQRELLAPACVAAAIRSRRAGRFVQARCLQVFAERAALQSLSAEHEEVDRLYAVIRSEPAERAEWALRSLRESAFAWALFLQRERCTAGPREPGVERLRLSLAGRRRARRLERRRRKHARQHRRLEHRARLNDERDAVLNEAFKSLPSTVLCALHATRSLIAARQALALTAIDPARFAATGEPPEAHSLEYWDAYGAQLDDLLDALALAASEATAAALQFMAASDIQGAWRDLLEALSSCARESAATCVRTESVIVPTQRGSAGGHSSDNVITA